jgi:hypothetical protein
MFQPVSAVSLNLAAPNDARGADEGVVVSPRITYEGLIVVARRTWRIASAFLPKRPPKGGDVDYFIEIQRWTERNGIPARCFVRVEETHQRPTPNARPKEAARSADDAAPAELRAPVASHQPKVNFSRRDNRKPQFIDFASPLMVDLFGHLGGQATSVTIVIEECLPEFGDGFAHGDDCYAAECVFQVQFPAGTSCERLPDDVRSVVLR